MLNAQEQTDLSCECLVGLRLVKKRHPLPNGERLDVGPSPWYRMALDSLTMCELSGAHSIPEEFAPVRLRLQLEWIFNGGFVSRSTGFTFVFDSQRIVHSMNSL